MPDKIMLDAQIQLTNDPQPMLEQQIVVLMNAACLGVLNGNDAGIGPMGFDGLKNQIERLTGQKRDRIAEETSSGNFTVSSPFALKGDSWRVFFGHLGGLKEPLLIPGRRPLRNSQGAWEPDRVRGRGSCITGEKFKINVKAVDLREESSR